MWRYSKLKRLRVPTTHSRAVAIHGGQACRAPPRQEMAEILAEAEDHQEAVEVAEDDLAQERILEGHRE